ncbi:segregation/condensation protein A [Bacillus glycinifermentans]|uniref:Segregation and condensation protein A n=2 Tax=Bacillus glycinifermentans TaxID=1664069 RepID=A0ABU6H146_9BACI|nr:segregation/condensation protein A [Bacillus glycinifermentans]MEC0484736.1 segregation/condensation protein A [Bacillus glycinifermentans]MEC0494603.1 segregation/condensation protein A [Bacillus glycinifermentans]MEC0541253.1 segregation/condensation protein A [Bacillus glycinifermentans]MEC3608946.1 segregation/condensation protein A [Bacillus glycinifermentans]UOY90761.1 segregation/condensation protein A [Bacillus glycinifermentans]
MMEYQVKIEAFEGPLDLLLHLINRLEIDIYDIPVAKITEQYLLYVHTMRELELDVASEYLVMAATLLSIKSRMLLPKQEEELFDEEMLEEEEDPRDELIEKLIEYRKYKSAAQALKEREEERQKSFAKPPSDLSEYAKEVKLTEQKLSVTVYDMLGAFQKVLNRKKISRPSETRISRQEIPIEERMTQIVECLRSSGKRMHFMELFPFEQKQHLVVTFLAILELMKNQLVIIEQERNFSDIYITGSEAIHDA